jgi:hypothetical protein
MDFWQWASSKPTGRLYPFFLIDTLVKNDADQLRHKGTHRLVGFRKIKAHQTL